jgi:serine phosphatase RsbU (regulator of sigma subunit)
MRLASAGHPLPLKASPSGDVESPKLDTAMCVLWQELDDVPCIEVPFRPGDRWAFYTDGITDRQAPDGTMFDLERLSAAVERHRDQAPAKMVDAIVADLEKFSAGEEPEDDQTLLIVGV